MAAGAVLLASNARPAAAHDPTDLGNVSWDNVKTTEYKFASAVPPWLKPVVDNVLELGWDNRSTNNSKSVEFSYDGNSSGKGVIHYTNTAPFCGSEWLGCADSTTLPEWHIWVQSNPGSVEKAGGGTWEKWCDLEEDPGCPDAGRTVIHEAGHVGDLDHYATSSWTRTIMQPAPPENPIETWNKRTLGPCDEALLQLLYDVWSKWLHYSKCLDHVANAENDVGLKTALTTRLRV